MILGPAPRQRPVKRVAGAQVAPLREQGQGREGDAEADQRNGHGQRRRLHLARFERVGLIGERRGPAVTAPAALASEASDRDITGPSQLPWPMCRATGFG